MKHWSDIILLYQDEEGTRVPAFREVILEFSDCSSLFSEYMELYAGMHERFFSFNNYVKAFNLEFNVSRCFQQFSPTQLSKFVVNHFKASFDMHDFKRVAAEFLFPLRLDERYIKCFMLACILWVLEYELEFEDVFLDSSTIIGEAEGEVDLSLVEKTELLQTNAALLKRLKITEYELAQSVEQMNRFQQSICKVTDAAIETEDRAEQQEDSSVFLGKQEITPIAIENLIEANKLANEELTDNEKLISELNSKIEQLTRDYSSSIATNKRCISLERENQLVKEQYSKKVNTISLELEDARDTMHGNQKLLREALSEKANAVSALTAAQQELTSIYGKLAQEEADLARIEPLQEQLEAYQERHQEAGQFLADISKRIKLELSRRDAREAAYVLEIEQLRREHGKPPFIGVQESGGGMTIAERSSAALLDEMDSPHVILELPQAPRKGSLGIRKHSSLSTDTRMEQEEHAWELAISTESSASSLEQLEFFPENYRIKSIASLPD